MDSGSHKREVPAIRRVETPKEHSPAPGQDPSDSSELTAKDRLDIERLNKKGRFQLADLKLFALILVLGVGVLAVVGARILISDMRHEEELERQRGLELMQQMRPHY